MKKLFIFPFIPDTFLALLFGAIFSFLVAVEVLRLVTVIGVKFITEFVAKYNKSIDIITDAKSK